MALKDKLVNLEDLKVVGDEVADLRGAIIDVGYVKNEENTLGEFVKGYWSNGEFTADENNKGRKILVGDAKKINIVGYFSKWYDYYDFFDSEDQIISYLRNTTSAGNDNITVDVPQNAEYMCISGGSANDTANKKVYLIYGASTEIKELQTKVNDLDSLNGLMIEGYEKSSWADITDQATHVAGKYAEMINGKVVISTGNFQYCVLDVIPGEVYKTTGMNYFDMRPAIYADDDGNILYYLPTDRKTTAEHVTIETTVPEGATKLYIDEDRNNSIQIQKKGVYYIKDTPGETSGIVVQINRDVTLDTTVITNRGGTIRQKLEVYNNTDQPNSAVLPRSVEVYMGGNWKEIVNNEDDNCPVNLGSGYIGAGHGYGRAFNLNLTGHGKTYADIGSKWVTDATYPRNFYIVRIIDEDNLIVLGADEPDSAYDTVNYWGNSTSLTHVEGATHTDTMTGYTRTQYLLAPIDKNHTKKVLLDGITEASDDGEYRAEAFVDIVEEYDVINPQGIIPTILANMPQGGYTENPEIDGGSTFLHFSNIYRILSDGTMLLFSSLDNDVPVTLNYWGATQYAQKTSASTFGGALFRYIPKALPIDNRDFRTPFNMANWNFTANITTQYWEDADNPPDRLLHLYTDGNGQYVAGFAVGYLPVADGSGSERKTNISNAMYLYQTQKAYFHLADNGGADAGAWAAYTPYQCIVYRKPVLDVGNIHTDAYFVPNGEICYLYADYHAIADDRIKVPAEYVGKPMTVLEKSDNVTVYGTLATDEIRIRVTTSNPMYGYAVIQIGE